MKKDWENNLKVDKRGIKIRFLTEVREENVQYCKKMLEEIKHIEMRHMDGVKGNFVLQDDTYPYVLFAFFWYGDVISTHTSNDSFNCFNPGLFVQILAYSQKFTYR